MDERGRRYWAIRTDRNNKSLLLAELRKGVLRQGWGQEPSHNLVVVQKEITKGGNWGERLSKAQKAVLPHLRMLSTAEDSVQVGDIVLMPNLPEDGSFMLAEIAGDYSYEPLKLSKEHDINDLGKDYGHKLPVRVLTRDGINNHAEQVAASIRRTLRARGRMWNLDQCGDAIEKLIVATKSGADLSVAKPGEARLQTAWETALSHANDELQRQLASALDENFHAAEWEHAINVVLRKLYPAADVRWTGGPKEHGADFVVEIPNHFGGSPWLILVQVKNYEGEMGASVAEQLKEGYDHYSKQGKLLSVVVMTTAERVSPECRSAIDALADKFYVPFEVILRKEMIKMFSDALTGTVS